MLNLTSIDWIIIGIAITALLIALMLLRPQVSHRDTQHIRKIREEIEKDQEKVTDTLKRVEQQADHVDQLGEQLQTKVEQLEHDAEASQSRAEQAQKVVDRAKEAEHELRNISTQLGERLEHVQGYWNDQLTDTVESVNTIRSKLKSSLEGVDNGLGRLREQEQMAQGFTRKLIEHQKQQGEVQRLNAELSREVHQRIESMLVESSRTLEQIRTYQDDSDLIYQSFTDKMGYMEDEANSHFGNLFQTTDIARQELNASLEESRRHLETLRRREEQSNELSQKLRQRLETNDVYRADRLTQAINTTDQICGSLQTDLEKARQLLNTLEQSSNDHSPDPAQEHVQEPNPNALFPEDEHPTTLTDQENNENTATSATNTDTGTTDTDAIELLEPLPLDMETHKKNKAADKKAADRADTHKDKKPADDKSSDTPDADDLASELPFIEDDEPVAQRKLFSLRAYR